MIFNYSNLLLSFLTYKIQPLIYINYIDYQTNIVSNFYSKTKALCIYTEKLLIVETKSKKKNNKITSFILLDSPLYVLKTLIGQLIKNGKKQKITNMFLFFLFNFQKTFTFFIIDELEIQIKEDFNLPYSLGKKHTSNRVSHFPRPTNDKANWKFFFKSFSKEIKKHKHGNSIYLLIINELLKLIFYDPTTFIFKEIDNFLEYGHQFRMFIHYRWNRKRIRKVSRRIRFSKKRKYLRLMYHRKENMVNKKRFHFLLKKQLLINRYHIKPVPYIFNLLNKKID